MNKPLIPVFYSDHMSVPDVFSTSPSAGKPAIVAQALRELNFPVEFRAPRGLLFWEIIRAHDPAFVTGVLKGKLPNGFGSTDRRVARSLPYTSGSMLDAALAARKDCPAVSLSSGFHHAGWDRPSGFCTFNGLAITAVSLLERYGFQRVAILDLDAHYGNGTDEILRRLAGSVSVAGGFHLPDGDVLHRTMGQHHAKGGAYLRKLDDFLDDITSFGPQVILFQAGADPPCSAGSTSPWRPRRTGRNGTHRQPSAL